jgi:hypothetical protein
MRLLGRSGVSPQRRGTSWVLMQFYPINGDLKPIHVIGFGGVDLR